MNIYQLQLTQYWNGVSVLKVTRIIPNNMFGQKSQELFSYRHYMLTKSSTKRLMRQLSKLDDSILSTYVYYEKFNIVHIIDFRVES